MQTRSSKNTCQNFGKKNAVYKYLPPNTKLLFDYGCGKYDNNKKFCEENDIEWIGYDLYWKTQEENEQSISYIEQNKDKLDCIVCSNLLNVLDDEDTIYEILSYLKNISNPSTIVLFSCYSGDKSGVGKETKKDCWQRNEKPIVWKKRLDKYFEIMFVFSDVFICKQKSD